MIPDNYNPIRHNCEEKGCWNKQYRPNIEWFYHALPRKLTMSDIDAVAEVNGHVLFMEWKSHLGPLPTGQRILAKRLTELSTKVTQWMSKTSWLYTTESSPIGNPATWKNCMSG